MANRKEKIERGTFGAAPVLGVLPNVKGLDDDVKMFAAIGHIGGNMQWLVCSTMFFFGSLGKKKNERFNGSKAWEAYYDNSGLSYSTADSKKSAKQAAVVYAEFAQVKKWDTQELAGRIFEHPHGSQGQKAAAIRKIMDNHADKPPTDEELGKLLPKKKTETERSPSIKARAKGIKTSVAGIREDEDMLALIESNATLEKRFEALETAASQFFDMAETVEKLAKKAADNKAEGKANKAALAAALKAEKPGKGARLN